MREFLEAARRARAAVATNNAGAVVMALSPHLDRVQGGNHLGAALDLAWAFGAMGRCSEAEGLLQGILRNDDPTRLAVSLARAGWF